MGREEAEGWSTKQSDGNFGIILPCAEHYQNLNFPMSRKGAGVWRSLCLTLLEGTNKILCTPGPRRKEQRPHKRLTQTCPWVSKRLWWRRGSAVACCRVRGTECSSAWDLLKEVAIIFITSTTVWPQVKLQGVITAPPINRKLDYRFTEHGPTYQNNTQFPPQSVSLIRKLSYTSYPSPSEGRQTEDHNHRKLSNLITWSTGLSNSVKLWAMPYRATQDRWVMVECSDKTWSTGEGDGKLLCIFAFRTPWTPWKGKKIRQWKMNSPGW